MGLGVAGSVGAGFCARRGGGGHTWGVWPAVRNISKCLYCGIGQCDQPMGGGGHRRVRGVDDEPEYEATTGD